ncbi:carbon-nitrogen hydrolase [Schizopora paradoxa]|uniref:Carbon-nitrogen hydrolase n=1 Tax=Schizopora paradoxa TaxID=27342 RepID=A0A0H2RRA6_9AGAM|nr:carbon-nitrogen hydrolase [Schizopora paradoxa]
MSRVVRAAVVQACTEFHSLDGTLDKLTRFAKEARENGAQLIVFPEAFIGGYPKLSTFGTALGVRSDEGREEFLKYHQNAIEVPSATTQEIARISKELDLFFVIGVIEKDGGTLYCTVIFITPSDGYLCKHRKLMPTAFERVVWGNGDASTMPVVKHTFYKQPRQENDPGLDADTNAVSSKLSATICWENYMPLLRTFYYANGTEIYCAPTVDARPSWQHTMRHIALEGRCFVLSACQYSEEKDYPLGHAGVDPSDRNPHNVMIGGGSIIVNPLGEVLAGPLLGKEGVLYADLDLDDVVRGKFDLDVVGHYARKDIFQLSVAGKAI